MPIKSNPLQLMELLEKFKPMLEKRVLNITEAADHLGLKKSSLYKLTCKKQIPHFKPRGKMIYFDRDDLDLWLLRNRVATGYEIEEKAIDYIARNKRGLQ